MYYTIELYLEKGQVDYTGEIQNEDRYIIVDSYGYDACGEHMTLEDAKKFINEIYE
jgi:hypothetical protein